MVNIVIELFFVGHSMSCVLKSNNFHHPNITQDVSLWSQLKYYSHVVNRLVQVSFMAEG